MWSLGLALQHTKADIHRVTFFEIIHGLRPLEKKKIVLSPELNVLKTALAPAYFIMKGKNEVLCQLEACFLFSLKDK